MPERRPKKEQPRHQASKKAELSPCRTPQAENCNRREHAQRSRPKRDQLILVVGHADAPPRLQGWLGSAGDVNSATAHDAPYLGPRERQRIDPHIVHRAGEFGSRFIAAPSQRDADARAALLRCNGPKEEAV